MLWALLTRETGLLKSSGVGNLDVFVGESLWICRAVFG